MNTNIPVLKRDQSEIGDMNIIAQEEPLSLVFSSLSEEEAPDTIAYPNVIDVPRNVHQCTLCDRSFSLSVGLTRHLNRTHGQKPNSKRGALRTADGKVKCKNCNQVFNNIYSLAAHGHVHKRAASKTLKTPRSVVKPQAISLKAKTNWMAILRARKTPDRQSVPKKAAPPLKHKDLIQEKHPLLKEVAMTKSLAPSVGQEPEAKQESSGVIVPAKQESFGVIVPSKQCSECCLVFKDANLLSLHIMSHKDDRLYKCVHCGGYFLNLAIYSQHKC